jgi:hypothetical protein
MNSYSAAISPAAETGLHRASPRALQPPDYTTDPSSRGMRESPPPPAIESRTSGARGSISGVELLGRVPDDGLGLADWAGREQADDTPRHRATLREGREVIARRSLSWKPAQTKR